jgi:hypothetical protein
VIVGSTVDVPEREGLEDYPAYLVPLTLMMTTAMRRLHDMCCGPAGPWLDILLSHQQLNHDRLLPCPV